MEDLFSLLPRSKSDAPLADRMRPRALDEFIGQLHLVGKGRLLRRAIEADRLGSSIFYGPPGCGKTSLASVIAAKTRSDFVKMNAVTSGVADVRVVIDEARRRQQSSGAGTILLLDECHRWSKAQSDSILPALEEGTIRFIGSTTENPLISMTPAIVSRCRIFHFTPIDDDDIISGMRAALTDAERGLGHLAIRCDADALEHLAHTASGDIRSALNALELAALTTDPDADGTIHITLPIAAESIQKPALYVDETLYYDMLSAFCKSLRGSDSDAALAWFARLMYSGCDPWLIVRRIIAHASEDVGLANPNAMLTAAAAATSLQHVGMPEAKLPISQAIITVCESPKSNSVVSAIDAAYADAEKGDFGAVPISLRDTSYKGSQRLTDANGESPGLNYKYPHDYPGHWIEQNYMPSGLEDRVYYVPSDQGAEANIRKKKQA
ncbi:MAG: replication-associated recombination protein A [Oscillospiraceae bacterium]|nr:replication-associated recombination protein A [Oscillospiraceae bacterium]